MLYFLAYPTRGLSHCLAQDKQLELAHAVSYYQYLILMFGETSRNKGIIRPTRTFGCVSSELDLRDLHVEENDA